MDYRIAVIHGDGIGPEVVNEAIKVLNKVGEVYGHHFTYDYVLAGGCAIDNDGTCLPQETIDKCKKADAVLLVQTLQRGAELVQLREGRALRDEALNIVEVVIFFCLYIKVFL